MRRAIAVMQALQGLDKTHGRASNLREVVAATGLPTLTAHRCLQSLLQAGVVVQPRNDASRAPSRGRYHVQWPTPADELPEGRPSQATRDRLVKLAGQTGQIALLYVPYSVSEQPRRVCTAHASPSDQPITHADVKSAPLSAHAPGMAIAAAMGCCRATTPTSSPLPSGTAPPSPAPLP
ncbi:hypothetical protein DY245_42860 [Streptomyces inhibens]|uniref:HTH iclR-type domain-containing protein n=1 Tax=Streptomyces inhibens TaxID=2293571 RepID=A0A371PPQ7_STRIH|nr:hypothetical protein DY245_42860 [Streptomyces inhibens]